MCRFFESYEYLTEPTGYCEHCLNIMHPNKDRFYKCSQCPSGFDVCTKCINLMKTEHPAQHSFKKDNYSMGKDMMIHYNITCDGCKAENFQGIRYQCDDCRDSYDLCASCYENVNKLHPSHKFTIVQSPLLRLNNIILMARRAIQVLQKFPNLQRDPLTGYTLQDAKQVKEKEEKNLDEFWQERLRQQQRDAEFAKQRMRLQLEHAQELRAILNPNYHITQMRSPYDF